MLAWALKAQRVGEQGRLPEAGGLGSMSEMLAPAYETELVYLSISSELGSSFSVAFSLSQCTVISTRYTLIACVRVRACL